MDVCKEYENKIQELSPVELNKEWDDVMDELKRKLNVVKKTKKVRFVRKTSSSVTFV